MTAEQVSKMTAAEKNAHYGKLNQKFDDRAILLRNLGFEYQQIPGMPVAVFIKTRYDRNHVIPACVLLMADEIVWADHFENAYNFCR